MYATCKNINDLQVPRTNLRKDLQISREKKRMYCKGKEWKIILH